MRRTKILLGITTLIGVLFIAALVIWFIRPMWKETHRLANEITEKQVELDAQYTQLKKLLESNDAIEVANQTVESLRGQFVVAGEELDFITSVEEIADEEGVQAEIVISTPSAKKGPKRRIAELVEDFEISFNGDFTRVHRAITALDRLPQITVTDTLAIRALRGSGDDSPPRASSLIRGKLAFPPVDL